MRRAAPPWRRPRLLPTILLLVVIVTVASGVKPDRRTWEENKGERTIRRLTNAVRRPERSGNGPLGAWEVCVPGRTPAARGDATGPRPQMKRPRIPHPEPCR